MGRKCVSEEIKKNDRLEILLNNNLSNLIKDISKDLGISKGAFTRLCIKKCIENGLV